MLSISFSKFGISLTIFTDKILIRWPFSGNPILHSYFYNRDFSRIMEYIRFIRRPKTKENDLGMVCSDSGKIVGVSFEEIMRQWLIHQFPHEYVVTLRNINISSKGADFWIKLSRDKVLLFLHKEFVLLRCKDKKSAIQLISSIPYTFAEAVAFEDSTPFAHNSTEDFLI